MTDVKIESKGKKYNFEKVIAEAKTVGQVNPKTIVKPNYRSKRLNSKSPSVRKMLTRS